MRGYPVKINVTWETFFLSNQERVRFFCSVEKCIVKSLQTQWEETSSNPLGVICISGHLLSLSPLNATIKIPNQHQVYVNSLVSSGRVTAQSSVVGTRYMGVQFSSVQFSCSVVSDSLRPHELQHARPSCPLPTPRIYSNSCPLSWWCYPTISSSLVPFSSCLQSFRALGSFQISQFFMSGGQSIGVSVSASVLPMNIQYWFPLGWTGWISLQSKGISRVFSNTIVQKHQFFVSLLSL